MKKLFDKYDYLLMIIIVSIYAVISFINLGSFDAPNTFLDIKANEEVIVELKNDTYVNKIKIFAGRIGEKYKIYTSDDNSNYKKVLDVETSAFCWNEEKISKTTRFVKFKTKEDAALGEIAFYDNSMNKIEIKKITLNDKKVSTLTDEASTIPKQISYFNSSYFDEVYFARSAYEYVHNYSVYESTHPPLGKLIQAIPIKLFKMAPFYYRFMGNIAGILMVLVMYIFAKKLFKKRIYAATAALLMAFDTFHFAQTRMGTVDSMLVLFIILAFYFMYNFINEENETRNLFLSGLFFGLATSTKWIGLYAGLALAVIFFVHVIKHKKITLKLFIKATLFFVIIPLIIYIGSYYVNPNIDWFNEFSIKEVFNQAVRMYNYHANLTEGHFSSSPFYTWPLSYRPVWYYESDIEPNLHASITGLGNIVIWWLGIISFFYIIFKLFKKKDKIAFFLICAIVFTYLPFVFISRAMFLYHYFSILPFVMFANVYLFKDIAEKVKSYKFIYVYLVMVIIFFIIYYPAVSGVYMPKNYFEFIKIFDAWSF